MDTWIELISEPIRSAALDLELACQQAIDLLPAVVCGMLAIMAALRLHITLRQIYTDDRGLSGLHNQGEMTEQEYEWLADGLSQPPTGQNQCGCLNSMPAGCQK